MNPFTITLYLFLAIFLLTSLVALASLIGLVQIEPHFKRRLFNLLIAQVITSVVGFAGVGVHAYMEQGLPLTSEILVSSHVWKWEYQADRQHWETTARFETAGDRLRFIGETRYVGSERPERPVIIDWRGTPFTGPGVSGAHHIEFSATMTYTKAGGQLEPSMASVVGVPRQVTIALDSDRALRGTWTLKDSSHPGGIMFTRDWQ